MSEYSPGLEGIIAGETSICSISDAGLAYRGYPIGELAQTCSFEEVAYLLLHGELPAIGDLDVFRAALVEMRPLPELLIELLRRIPADVHPMDALRSAVSLQAHFDPDAA